MPNTTSGNDRSTEVRIAGYGGQGIILAGMLLGKAASLYDNKEAVFTQAYGPEARGGASSADVVVADKRVGYPLVTQPDVLVALFQEAYLKFRPGLKPDGLLIIEQDLVEPDKDDKKVVGIPASRMAEELGRRIVANVVILGYLIGRTGIVSRESVEKAIESTVKPKTIDLNIKALAAGLDKAKEDMH